MGMIADVIPERQDDSLASLLERLKDRQMFELHVLRGLTPREVARTLGVSTARVYPAKHRLSPLVKRVVREMEALLVRSGTT